MMQHVTRMRIVEAARGWIGTPYHHQASVRHVGTDCLGLVRGVWKELYGADAEKPPAYSRDWAEASRSEAMLEAADRHLVAKPIAAMTIGDVVVFRLRAGMVAKHAAIVTVPAMMVPAMMVHAIEGAPVAEVPLTNWWRRRIAGAFQFPHISKGS